MLDAKSIDFIGDIHGHAEELKQLLAQLGYVRTNGYYQHHTRKAFFVGDFIDRGPQIKEVLEIVRPMIDAGAAYTVIGNHEYNAINYWTKGRDGNHLRPHTDKNTGQHWKTIRSVGEELLLDYVDWFRTLPIYFETSAFRVVHAQWKPEHIEYLKGIGVNSLEDPAFLTRAASKGTKEYEVAECLLKGEEVDIPGIGFKDKDGNLRYAYRIKWWLRGERLPCKESLFEFPIDDGGTLPIALSGYHSAEPPVFFGHYWLKDNMPMLQAGNVCCLDYSVAKQGKLVAYRWNGAQELVTADLLYVGSL